MKMISRVLMTAVAVAALAAPAMAADKLIVRDSGDTVNVFRVTDGGMIEASGGTITSTGNNAIAANISPTLNAGINYDTLVGLKVAPTINAGAYLSPGLYSLQLPGSNNGWVRMQFGNTNTGTAAQAGIELNNDAGQALITFYGSQYSSATLRNSMYIKNAVGGMKVLGFTGSSIGFGIGTTAAEANSIVVDASKRVLLGTVPTYADNAAATTAGLPVGTLYRTSTGVVMIRY